MTDITLETGQTVQLRDGIVQVQPAAKPPPHHYRMTVQHQSGGLIDVRTALVDDAMAFLRQLEPLGYVLRNIVRLTGTRVDG
jgi:uncharacterized protein with LGFP repeats